MTMPADDTQPRPRKGFCPRCDAPIYSDEKTCTYCGDGPSDADFKAVAVLSLLVLSALALIVLLLA
ncbi:MAG TPA: hypothetical protein VKN99_20910 [Polyangia bacterium]|nr:hypothetical protein [Polyangia bacterium]